MIDREEILHAIKQDAMDDFLREAFMIGLKRDSVNIPIHVKK